jgi:glycogen debranching enzyme
MIALQEKREITRQRFARFRHNVAGNRRGVVSLRPEADGLGDETRAKIQRGVMNTLAPPLKAERLQESAFYIPATGSPTRHRSRLKHNDTFVVLDSHGDIGAAFGEPDGLFNNDTRYLSRLELHLNGEPSLLLGSRVRDDNSVVTADLTNPDIFSDGKIVLRKDTVHVARTSFVWNDTFYTRFCIRNFGDISVDLSLDLWFASDFADIFEVRGMRRPRRGTSGRTLLSPGSVRLSYLALDGVSLRTSMSFEPKPARLEEDRAHFHVRLEPGKHTSLYATVGIGDCGAKPPVRFFRALRAATRVERSTTRKAVRLSSSSEAFNDIAARSLSDLRMLMTRTADGDYPYAGIPWYSTTFGRDGIITALQLLWCMPSLARGVLSRLAALQATSVDRHNDAEPGKILHEMRSGEMARLREVPFGRYYGSVDATPLFVLLAGEYWQRTSDSVTIERLWPNICAALTWIDKHSLEDENGFLRHSRNADDGLVNQGWKDSYDSIFHADGRLAEGTIALVEVQAYVVAAKRSIAKAAAAFGHDEMAERLAQSAQRLAAAIERCFWCEELGTYGIAIDGAGELCRVRTSNAGHVLFAAVASDERARRVAADLMSPRFLTGWGVRTVADGEARYNPMSYHNGSVWPHDNAMVAIGFANYGLKEPIASLLAATSAAAFHMDLRRLPELFCGFKRSRGQAPTLYPVACAPQAWASAAPLAMLQACLGLTFEPRLNRIVLGSPFLPGFLDSIVLRNVEIGRTTIDFALRRRRDDDTVSLQILQNDGGVEVAVK